MQIVLAVFLCKGGSAVGLITQILEWVCIRYKGCNSNLKQGKSKEAILWHLRNLEKWQYMNQAGITTKNTFHDPKRRLIERRENTYRIGRRTGNLQTIGRDRKGIERLDMEELLQILSEIQIPFAYHHFAEGESPEPPFICYLLSGNNNFSADGKIYYKINEVHIELYTDWQ